MGIDRIGKPGWAPQPAGDSPQHGELQPIGNAEGGIRPAEPTSRAFNVANATPSKEVTSPEAVQETGALQRFRAGAIDLDSYLDAKVQEATEHLHDLAPLDLDAIRSALRDRLAHDPTLVDLVQKATGVEIDATAGSFGTRKGDD